MRSWLMVRYVLSEMIPTFFIGVIVFVFILLMFQALRLTEFVLIHGLKLSTVGLMVVYLSSSFLPILFPMSLLFAVLLTYSRLSADSEVTAFRAAGLSMSTIVMPALILSILVGILSVQTSFHIAPWGNRQFETLVRKAGSVRPGITLKEGTFLEGFFDLVVYANRVDSNTGTLGQVFIYDEANRKTPITVIAREGRLIQDPEKPGHSASLRLVDGSIHRTSGERHTKINFSTYDIFLSQPEKEMKNDKSSPSLTIEEVREALKKTDLKPEMRRELETEMHRRVAISFACILFAMIGVGLGTTSNRRNVKSGGTVICVALIVIYWIIYVTAEGAARQGTLAPAIAMWIPNAIFSIAALFTLRKAWR